jgi:DNA-binding ferritin-like protein
VASETTLRDVEAFEPTGATILSQLAVNYRELAVTLKLAIHDSDEASDPATSDVLINTLRRVDHHSYLIVSHLG